MLHCIWVVLVYLRHWFCIANQLCGIFLNNCYCSHENSFIYSYRIGADYCWPGIIGPNWSSWELIGRRHYRVRFRSETIVVILIHTHKCRWRSRGSGAARAWVIFKPIPGFKPTQCSHYLGSLNGDKTDRRIWEERNNDFYTLRRSSHRIREIRNLTSMG